MRIFRPRLSVLLVFVVTLAGGAVAGAQTSAGPLPAIVVPAPDPLQDVLFFKDGDRIQGTLVRIERGDAIFRSRTAGEVRVDLDQILDLRCQRKFAILRKGLRVNQRNAVIGRLEVRGTDLIVTPDKGPAVLLRSDDVTWGIEDVVFEREVARIVPFHEGWSGTVAAGASLVRSTENGTAFNASGSLSRAVPGVGYLPRRRRTDISAKESYALADQPTVEGEPPQRSETHTFHAQAEHNEYFHTRFYVLADYSFDRNFSSGLLAEELGGGGLGVTLVKNATETLDVKFDVHRATEAFIEPSNNTVLVGQKLVVEYERSLPGGLTLNNVSDYLPAYNHPHDYSANTTLTLTVPIYRSLGVSFTTTDNYINNPVPGLKHNTFQFETSLTFSH